MIEERTVKYRNATQLLTRGACRESVRKIVMTGAATSVIGPHPKKEGVYYDSNEWADVKDVLRPNEKSKLIAERTAWDEILKN